MWAYLWGAESGKKGRRENQKKKRSFAYSNDMNSFVVEKTRKKGEKRDFTRLAKYVYLFFRVMRTSFLSLLL